MGRDPLAMWNVIVWGPGAGAIVAAGRAPPCRPPEAGSRSSAVPLETQGLLLLGQGLQSPHAGPAGLGRGARFRIHEKRRGDNNKQSPGWVVIGSGGLGKSTWGQTGTVSPQHPLQSKKQRPAPRERRLPMNIQGLVFPRRHWTSLAEKKKIIVSYSWVILAPLELKSPLLSPLLLGCSPTLCYRKLV